MKKLLILKKYVSITSFLSVIKSFWFYRFYQKVYLEKIYYKQITNSQKRYIEKMKKRPFINVVFVVSTISMWKGQKLYDLLSKNERFKLYVFLSPFVSFEKEIQIHDIKQMRIYFSQRSIPYVDWDIENDVCPTPIKHIVDPDIMFYTQPAEHGVVGVHDYLQFKNKLLCYIPYYFMCDKSNKGLDRIYHNLAWKLFYQTDYNVFQAQLHSQHKGKRAVVVGYTLYDDFILPPKKDVWKKADYKVKRVIWAPHWTIFNNRGFFHASNFINMAEFMKDVAKKYSGRIVFSFKPHPSLRSQLYEFPEWGRERTEEYYDFWRNSDNTQLDEEDYVDLFKTSDAMIHDSSSFVIDYLYCNKPVLYDNPNINDVKEQCDEFGQMAYDLHYCVNNNEDIIAFLDNVVLGEKDLLKPQRELFYHNYMLPPHGGPVAQNIYNDIIRSLDLFHE